MHIKELADTALDKQRWDDFVLSCPEATFFHRAGWKRILEHALGHRGYFIYVEDDQGAIMGVLPLGHVKTRLFGNTLMSLPFCVYGGVAATCVDARSALEQRALELGRELGVDCIEFRYRQPCHPEWPTKSLYVTFRKTLDPDPEKNLAVIPRKQRAMVRKGQQAGLLSEMDEGVDRFYEAYAASVHHLGTPVLAKRYYAMVREVFGSDCDVLTITKDNRLIASVMNFYFRDEVLPYYGGGTQEARAFHANDFMYWELMRRSCARGIRVFDYGRSKQGTGSYSFKKNWGFEPAPLYYEYALLRCQEMPEINPLNPKYRLFIKAWQAMPLSMTKLIGPWVARGLG